MNTLEQPLTESHENLVADEPRISRRPMRVRRRRGAFLVVPLSGIALLVHLLRSALGDPALPPQEFEGLGIVVCALAYIGIFLWGLTCVFEREAQQVEASEKPSEIPSAVVRRMQTGE